jgi:GGDEF domain-containing protein
MKEILDRTYNIKRRIRQPDIPKDIIPMIEELIANSLDSVCGMQLRWAFECAIDELCSKGIEYSVGIIDFRNLSGLNKYFEKNNPEGGAHEQANAILREIAQNAIQHCAIKNGGETYRIGGDEFSVIFPNMRATEAAAVMENMKECADKIVKAHGLENEPHPKHDYLPTGAGGIDYGCADSIEFPDRNDIIKAADNKLGAFKKLFLWDVVSKQPNSESWEWNEENEHFVQNIKEEK